MKAVFLAGKRKIEIRNIPVPEIKKDTDVLVRVKKVGICGSDIHYYLDGRIGCQVVEDDIILGHEAVGEVVEAGDSAWRVKKGMRVAIEPGVTCCRCEHCISGRPNLCPDVRFLGTPPVDGALAEYLVMPESNLFPLPEGISDDEGLLAEPLAIGLYGLKLSGMFVGDSVAVIGAGPIGLSVVFAAKMGGASRIFVSDLLTCRLEMAEKLGADRVVDASKENITGVVEEETAGRGVDIGYEAAGKRDTFKQSTEVVKRGGVSVIYGISSDDVIEFEGSVVRRKGISIINVRRSAHMTELALELIGKRVFPFSELVTHTFGVGKTEEGLKLVSEYGDGVIKAIVAF